MERLPAEDFCKHERGDNGGVRLDDELRSVLAEFTPGDFFIRDGTGIGAVAGR